MLCLQLQPQVHSPGTVKLDIAAEVDEKDEINDEKLVRQDEIGSLRVLCSYHPWDGLCFTLDITWLSEPMYLVAGPRLLCPLIIGESHEAGRMG